MLPILLQNPNFVSNNQDENQKSKLWGSDDGGKNQRSLWYEEMYSSQAYRANICLYIYAVYQ